MTAGKPKTFVATIILLVGLLAVGVLAFARQLSLGDVVTGMRTIGAGGAVWGLYVVMDGFFLGCGISVMATACIARFSRDRSRHSSSPSPRSARSACMAAWSTACWRAGQIWPNTRVAHRVGGHCSACLLPATAEACPSAIGGKRSGSGCRC